MRRRALIGVSFGALIAVSALIGAAYWNEQQLRERYEQWIVSSRERAAEAEADLERRTREFDASVEDIMRQDREPLRALLENGESLQENSEEGRAQRR